jgi:hypothetical protein
VVTIRFKLSDLGTVELSITSPVKFRRILRLCSEKTGSTIGPVIAVRNEKVLGLQDNVDLDDVIDAYPALSGG